MAEVMKKSVKAGQSLQIERSCKPSYQAMLQALRVVLDLPRKPIVLNEAEKENC
jgi:hypothetical protein